MRSIRLKLFLLFLLQAFLVIGAVTAVVAWSFDRGFLQYIAATNLQRTQQLVSQLQSIHSETGSWSAMTKDRRRWVSLVMGITGHDVNSDLADRLYEIFPANSFPPDMPAPLPLRYALLDASKNVLLGPSSNGSGRELYPIGDSNSPVGYLALNPGRSYRNLYDVEFHQQFTTGIIGAAISAVLFALLLAMGVSRRFLSPVSEVANAARRLASGDYQVRIAPKSEDELGNLSRDINELAIALGRHRELQKQWIADISHELRTPVSLLLARLEAVQDGIRQLDRGTIDSLHADVTRLSLMIEDLYMLSMSDIGTLKYRKHPVDLGTVAEAALESLADEFLAKDLSTELVRRPEALLVVMGDPDRLHQMLVNLLANSVRYTEPGGLVRVRIFDDGAAAKVQVDDSPLGVPESDLPHIFDRLFRSDNSRSRRSGGAGLGLTIAKTIVEAHDGTISARASELGGLQVEVVLPLIALPP